MGGSQAFLYFAIVLLLLALAYVHCVRQKNSHPPLPPGPPGKFLVGNLGQLSLEHPEQDYIRWGKQYSKSVASLSDEIS